MSSKLQRMINKAVREALQGNPEARERAVVQELTGVNPDEPGHSRGGFAQACQQSRVNMIREQLEKATSELANNPSVLASEIGEHEFREHYSSIPSEDLNQIIRLAKRGR